MKKILLNLLLLVIYFVSMKKNYKRLAYAKLFEPISTIWNSHNEDYKKDIQYLLHN